jgi:hypothetical protein
MFRLDFRRFHIIYNQKNEVRNSGPGARATAEDVRDHWGEIRDPEGYRIPDGIGDEMKAIVTAMKG